MANCPTTKNPRAIFLLGEVVGYIWKNLHFYAYSILQVSNIFAFIIKYIL